MTGGVSGLRRRVCSIVLLVAALFVSLSACDQHRPLPTLFEAPGQLSGEAVFEEVNTLKGGLRLSVLGNEYSTEAWMLSLAFLRAAEKIRETGQEHFVIVSINSNGAISVSPEDASGAICQEDGHVQLPGADLVVKPLPSMSEASEYVTVVSVAKVFEAIEPLAYGRDVEKLRSLIKASSSPCPDLLGGGRRYMPWDFLDVLSQPAIGQKLSELERISQGEEGANGDLGAAAVFPSFTSGARGIYLVAFAIAEEVERRGGDKFWITESTAILGCELALTRPEVFVDVAIVRPGVQPAPGTPVYSAASIIDTVRPIVAYDAVSDDERHAMRRENIERCEQDYTLERFGKIVELDDELAVVLGEIGGVSVAP